MVPIAYFFLPDTPDKARFLTEEEKVSQGSLRRNSDVDILKLVAKARGVRQVGGVERIGGIVWKEVGLALVDVKCWFTAVSKHLDFVGLWITTARLWFSSRFQRLIWCSSCTSAATLASHRFPVSASIFIAFD